MQAHRKQQQQRQSSGREFKSSHLALPHLQQDSNSYSNADDRQHYLATHSEQKSQEISTKKTPANTSEQAQAYPVFGIIQLMARHKTDHIQDMM